MYNGLVHVCRLPLIIEMLILRIGFICKDKLKNLLINNIRLITMLFLFAAVRVFSLKDSFKQLCPYSVDLQHSVTFLTKQPDSCFDLSSKPSPGCYRIFANDLKPVSGILSCFEISKNQYCTDHSYRLSKLRALSGNSR